MIKFSLLKLYFEIILDLRVVKAELLHTLHPTSSNVNILYNFSAIIKTKSFVGTILTKLQTLFRFCQFCAFSVLGSNPGSHLAFDLPRLLSLLSSVTPSLSSVTLRLLKNLLGYFV